MLDDIFEKLIDAVKQDEIVIVYELLHKNKDIFIKDSNVVELFQHVNSVEVLQMLFQYTEFERVIVCVNSLYSMSLITYEIMHGKNIDVISEIVKMGEDINGFDGRNRTPLIESLLSYRDVNFIEKLIAMGADVNQCNSYSRSPLHFAYNKDIFSLLIKNGANVNKMDENGQTPLLRALELNRDKETITALIEGGANLEYIDQNGNSVLHLTNDPELFNYFFSNNAALINGKNKKGQTPLMKSVKEHKSISLIKTILDNGGSQNCLDVNDHTPLHYAYNSELVNLLVSYGGNINARNKYNQLPLYTIFHHRPIMFSFGYNSAEAILKYTLLYNNSDIPNKCVSRDERLGFHVNIGSNFHIFTERVQAEANKMKDYKIIENMTFYDFCTFKKTKYNKVIKIPKTKYLYTNVEIKELFPNFYDIIIMKIERNELDVRRQNLITRLSQITIQSKPFDEIILNEQMDVDDVSNMDTDNTSEEFLTTSASMKSEKDFSIDSIDVGRRKHSSAEFHEVVDLDYDSLYCISRFLNYKQLSNLFRASML